MTARLFLDTNILIYAVDPDEPAKRKIASDLVRGAIASSLFTLSPQNLIEAYRVLAERRQIMPVADVRRYLGILAAWCNAPLDAETTLCAWKVQDDTGFSWWDSLLIASALRAECAIFFTEDMSSGRIVSGMKLVNPFVGVADR